MSQKFIYQYGKDLLEQDPTIKSNRVYFNFDTDKINKLDITQQFNTSPFLSEIIDKNNLPITSGFTSKTFFKLCSPGQSMGWHQDDIAVYRNSKKHITQDNPDRFTLYTKKAPKYSMVMYLSTIGIDFEGGEFCFTDINIKPNQGMGIFFDSRDVHKITEVKSGLRKSCVVKFYEK